MKKTIHHLKLLIFRLKYKSLYKKYSEFTMIPSNIFIQNIELSRLYRHVQGDVVECGVWRGGMIAGLAEIVGKDRNYHLFDSFEGLPDVQEIDGEEAQKWQNDKESKSYYDNCTAEISWAKKAMEKTKVNYTIHKGWFSDTLKDYKGEKNIAILRMDGDWYESTMEILDTLFHKVNEGGIIIIDDYYSWDGCSKAVHDFLSKNKLANRVKQYNNQVAYIVK